MMASAPVWGDLAPAVIRPAILARKRKVDHPDSSWLVLPMRNEAYRQFELMWPGGYFEGEPRDPLGQNTYGVWGFHSAIFTIYMACIRPYVSANTTVLEIGPGRGAWSKAILDRGAAHLYAVDAATAEHTRFWEHVGGRSKATYLVATDCSLTGVPDNSIDFFFSFGCFCHLPPEMSAAYIQALSTKMKPGAQGFFQFGDFNKYTRMLEEGADKFSLLRIIRRERRKVWLPTRLAYELSWRFFRSRMDIAPVSTERCANLTDAHGRGSWHHWSTADACTTLQASGFSVVESDIGILARDPIVHFRKPSLSDVR